MITIVALWIAQFILLSAIGHGFWKVFIPISSSSSSIEAYGIRRTWFTHFWIGLAVVITFLSLFHLLFPIGKAAFLIVVGTSILCLPLLIKSIRPALRNLEEGAGVRLVLFGILNLLLWFLLAMKICHPVDATFNSDTEGYHLPVVRLANEYAAIPGIAHLEGRYAIYSGFFLYGSLLNNFALTGYVRWLLPGFFILVTLAQWLWELFFPYSDAKRVRWTFAAITLTYLLKLVFTWVPYPGPNLYYDYVTFVVLLPLVLEVLTWAERNQNSLKENIELTSWTELSIYIIALAGLAFTFKLNAAMALVFSGLLVLTPMVTSLLGQRVGLADTIKLATRSSWLSILMICGWIGHNIIQTGWALFPAPAGNLKLPWSLSPEFIDINFRFYIGNFARNNDTYAGLKPDSPFPFWEWFPKKWEAFNKTPEQLILWSGLVAVVLLILSRSARRKSSHWIIDIFIVILPAACLLHWFNSAPSQRFGDGFFWLFFAGPMSITIYRYVPSIRISRMLGIAIFWILLLHVRPDPIRGELLQMWNPRGYFALPTPPEVPTKKLVYATDQSPNLVIFVPKGRNTLPGNHRQPCAVYPDPHIRWRVPGKLGSGFVLGATSAQAPVPPAVHTDEKVIEEGAKKSD